MMEEIVLWELDFLHALSERASSFWDVFWTFITTLGDAGIFWIALAIVLMVFRKTRRVGFSMGLALVLGLIFGNGVLKNVIGRLRPYDLDPTLIPRLAADHLPGDLSFPSGHTLASFEAATALFCYYRKWGIAALTLAAMIAFSRLYLLVHYPTDVLFGALMGVGLGLAAVKTVELLNKKYFTKQNNC